MNAPFTYASPTLSVEALKHSIAYKLMFTIGKDPVIANKHEWLNATLFAVRDRLVERWLRSNRAQLILLGLAGMATLLAATTHAPIMSTLMICEMTGEYQLLPGLLIACVVASVLSRTLRHDSIYRQHAAEH